MEFLLKSVQNEIKFSVKVDDHFYVLIYHYGTHVILQCRSVTSEIGVGVKQKGWQNMLHMYRYSVSVVAIAN